MEQSRAADQSANRLEPEPGQGLGEDEDLVFQISEVRLVGNDKISSEELEPLVEIYVNRDVYLSDVEKMAGVIKRYYRDKGYVGTYAYAPPQRLENGVLEIRVLEARVGQIYVEGNKWIDKRLILDRVAITRGNVLNYRELRRTLWRLNRYMNLESKIVLKPGAEPETVDITIKVEDDAPYYAGAGADNSGTDNTGKERVSLYVGHTNVLGELDHLDVHGRVGREVLSLIGQYEIPVHDADTAVELSSAASFTDVGGAFEPLDIEGDAQTYGAHVKRYFYMNENLLGHWRAGLDWKKSRTRILDAVSGTDEHRILNGGVELEFRDPWGANLLSQSAHLGLGILGASSKVDPVATRSGTGGEFFIYRGSWLRRHPLPRKMMLQSRLNTQWSPDRLAPSEQMSLGGLNSVRGYPQGDFLGDSGVFMSLEDHIPLYMLPDDLTLPWSERALKEDLRLALFCDFGMGVVKSPLPGETRSRTLLGAGLGLRFRLDDYLTAALDWAVPVGSTPSDGRGSAFYFSLSSEFL